MASPGVQRKRITPLPVRPGAAGPDEALREYYKRRTIRNRMREFLGSNRRDPTAVYIVGADGHPDFSEPSPASSLSKYLERGLEIDRSLWDRHSLLADLDIEYANFDYPGIAWTNPERAFELQSTVMDATLQTLRQTGIEPLVLLSGRGFHLVWSIDRGSPVFHRLTRLGHVNASLLARYAGVHAPAGETVEPDLAHAYAGLGMLVEFIGHRVLTQAADRSPVPIEMTAIETGPGVCGREIVSFDLSEYGDPLHRRHIRLPFSAYLKPKYFEWHMDPAPNVLPIFEIPLDGLSLPEAIGVARSTDAAIRLSEESRTFIPDCPGATGRLLDEYEASDLARFHKQFYLDTAGPPTNGFRGPVSGAPPCLNWLLENPNDWLLRPAALQYVSRVLMSLDWHPQAIAHLIAGCYEKDLDWGDQWVRLDPLNRAMFYTRLFCGMVATGVDRLIDLNCVSHREKGYCMFAGCSANLAPYRDRLLEKRRSIH